MEINQNYLTLINIYSTELVEKLDAKSNRRLWRVHVKKDSEDSYYTQQEYWSIKKTGEEGKHTFTALTKISRKNIGKINETSEEEQAIKEANALYNKYLDGVLDEDNFLPMLAQTYTSKKVNYPAYIQSKLDGIRCIVKPNKTFWTRKGKLINPKIVEHIAAALPEVDYILDGELILPKEFTFQETVSAVKKYGENTNKLELYLYDVYNEQTYEDRYNYLTSLDLVAPIYLCFTEEVTSELEFLAKSSLLIQAGYEGSIYRSKSGLYKPNVRSADLLKYKTFEDAEYEIVDVFEGKGKEEGCAIFQCRTSNGVNFNVRPTGNEEYRKQLWANKKELVGLQLTVKYMGLTDEGLPRFPVGISIRDYE